MAKSVAAQRAHKANRRKAIVAEKRKAEAVANSLAGQVRRAAALPLRDCLASETLFEIGTGIVIVTRGVSSRSFELATFLVDTYCLGVKDTFLRSIEGDDYDQYLDSIEASMARPVAIAPAEARKLLRDAAAWSSGFGFAQHKDYAVIDGIFGDVSAADSDAVFEFGRDGKPFYLPGPFDSSTQVRRVKEALQKRFGNEAAWLFDAGQSRAFEDEGFPEEVDREAPVLLPRDHEEVDPAAHPCEDEDK